MSRVRIRTVAPALIAAILGFTVTLNLRFQTVAQSEISGRRAALIGSIEQREKRAADLERRIADLRARLDAGGERATGTVGSLQRLLDELRQLSGLTAVSGKGLVITLADASGAEPSLNDADTHIQDVDLQNVVNELWAAGAEAIAVNGQRIITTTAIRNAGGAVLVNFHVLASPYRVDAIGDTNTLLRFFQASTIAQHLRKWIDVYGLGFDVDRAGRLQVPAYTGGLRMAEARQAG